MASKGHELARPLNDDVVEIATARAEARSRRETLLIFMVALQTAIILAMGVGATYAYSQVMNKAAAVDDIIEVINNPEQAIRNPAISKALAGLIQDTASSFFLGSPDGSVVSFIQDLAQTNFASIGAQIKPWAGSMLSVFMNQQDQPQCTQLVQCSTWGSVQCPDGNWVYCNGPGTIVNCGNCQYGPLVEVSSIVESIADRLSKLQQVTPSSNVAPAAFSDGIFRLNSVLGWMGNQANISSWREAAHACTSLAENVDNVNWSSNYTSANGNARNWDANQQVRQVTRQLRRYCPLIANMPSLMDMQKKQQSEEKKKP